MDVAVNLPYRECRTQPIALGILKALMPSLHQIDLAPKFNDIYLKIILGKARVLVEKHQDLETKRLAYILTFFYPLEAIFKIEDEWDEKLHELAYNLADLILGYDPKITCFSTYKNNIGLSLLVAKILAENQIKSIIGGPSILWKSHVYAKLYPWVSCFYEGEAETLFVKTFKRTQKGEKIRMVKAPPLLNLNASPIPIYDDLKLEEYDAIGVETQRGCVNRCSFCNVRFFPSCEIYREKSISRIVTEIQILKNHKREFCFCDNITNPTPKRLIELCKALEPLEIRWASGSFIPRISLREAYWMKRSGCFLAGLGVETLSDRLLKWMNKPINWKTIRETLANLKTFGIKVEISLIKGFPKERLIDTLISLVRLLSIKKYISIVSITPYYISQNSEVYNNPRRFNVNFKPDCDDSITHTTVYVKHENKLVKLLMDIAYSVIENV